MRGGGKRRVRQSKGKGTFDPEDAKHIKHTGLGVWDLYEEKDPKLDKVPGVSRVEHYLEMYRTMPYVWRMLKDIGSIRSCSYMLIQYLIIEVLRALIPATSLWYSGQLLKIVEIAVDERKVDTYLLVYVAGGRVACTLATRLLRNMSSKIDVPLNNRIRRYYSAHMFHAIARLDVPTYDDPAVQQQLESSASSSSRSSVCWETIVMMSRVIGMAVRLVSQISVLISVLHGQGEGSALLAVLSFGECIFSWAYTRHQWNMYGVWAATTQNSEYLRMEGMKRMIDDPSHRKEIVAGNMSTYLTKQYRTISDHLADKAGEFHQLLNAHNTRKHRNSIFSYLQEPLRELPQIAFTLRAVHYPASIPLSLASLHLIRETASGFSEALFRFLDETGGMADQLDRVRKLYDIENIQNKVVDGVEPYPEDQQAISNGLAVEFRRVSFKYPGTDKYALKGVSFKIGPGQLCIIVGANGSGKSTILKLIARIYDPTEGSIFIDERNIQNLKMRDLRRAISVLFQDYTHFPLSIRDNIALGDPDHAQDGDKILEAARLGGAEEFVERLDEGFDTYLDRPVRDFYSPLPEGTKTLFGRPVDYGRVRGMGGMKSTNSTSLSGGQMQRLAVARTFMRTITDETKVGLLLFDEPSASLDPTAEHDLFERLRKLRGNKTMLFSSHRFGNLTRHADLILYMNDSVVVEEGTHDDLIRRKGEYSRIWMLQAQAFLP